MKLLYEAGPQLVKVRLIMLFSLLCAAGSVWWGIDLAQTYGLAPGDGGVLAPLPVRLAWGIGVGMLGVAFAASMAVYGRCYASRLEAEPETGRVRVSTIGFFGGRTEAHDVGDFAGARYHEGRLDAEISVRAPWTSLRVRGRRLPLILDEQGKFHDRAELDRLIGMRKKRR